MDRLTVAEDANIFRNVLRSVVTAVGSLLVAWTAKSFLLRRNIIIIDAGADFHVGG